MLGFHKVKTTKQIFQKKQNFIRLDLAQYH